MQLRYGLLADLVAAAGEGMLKEQFLADRPANDREHYLEAWSGMLKEQGA